MLKFTRALLDHIAEPNEAPIEAVNIAHADILAEIEDRSTEEIDATARYMKIVEGPRLQINDTYDTYTKGLTEKGAAVSKYMKPIELVEQYTALKDGGLIDLYSTVPFKLSSAKAPETK